MYTQLIADILIHALISYHSRKDVIVLTKSQYLKNYLEKKSDDQSIDSVVRSFLKGVVSKADDTVDYESLLSGMYFDIDKLMNYINNPKIAKRTLKERVHFLAKKLKKHDFDDLINFNSSKKPFPNSERVIYLDSELYSDFLPDGELPDGLEIIIRFKSKDIALIKEQALKSGLLLVHRGSNHDGSIHDFVLFPGNNPPGYFAYSYFIKG